MHYMEANAYYRINKYDNWCCDFDRQMDIDNL